MDETLIELCKTFISECMDYIDEMEPQLIGLAQALEAKDQPGFNNLMNQIFRSMHTIKGSAGSLGFKNITAVAHRTENLLDSIRHGKLELTTERLDLLTRSLDVFRQLMQHVNSHQNDEGMEGVIEPIAMELDKSLVPQELMQASKPKEVTPGFFVFEEPEHKPAQAIELKANAQIQAAFALEADEAIAKIELNFIAAESASSDERSKQLTESMRSLHSVKGNCGLMQFHDLAKLIHAMETQVDGIAKNRIPFEGMDNLLKCVDVIKATLGKIGSGGPHTIDGLNDYLELISLTKADSLSVKSQTLAGASAGSKSAAAPAAATSGQLARSDVRVDLKKLDLLINLVGELVISEAMLSGWAQAKGIEDETLDRVIHHLRRTANSLQDVAMSVRMVPINQTFKKMIRLVHDTSSKLGKKVELELVGEDTEMDKTVIEQISDPIVHCVRNSIDHGLETPDERLKSEKPEVGTITLEARHEGGEVWIIIRDDGRGLNREKILSRARDRGLFQAERESQLNDQEIYGFIFEPGFSTAEQVTDISGRGVGMDVVKKNIEKIKGRIRINSVPGKGAEVIFQIPLTLAIIDGMMVRVGPTLYTIPILSIQESLRVTPSDIVVAPDGLEMLDVRAEFIPIIRLKDMLESQRRETNKDTVIVIVEVNGKSIGLVVDEILGQQQTVIKALPKTYSSSRHISGCSILGNGEVSLILDVAGVAETLVRDYESMLIQNQAA